MRMLVPTYAIEKTTSATPSIYRETPSPSESGIPPAPNDSSPKSSEDVPTMPTRSSWQRPPFHSTRSPHLPHDGSGVTGLQYPARSDEGIYAICNIDPVRTAETDGEVRRGNAGSAGSPPPHQKPERTPPPPSESKDRSPLGSYSNFTPVGVLGQPYGSPEQGNTQ